MGRTLGTAMTGRSKGRQELADEAIPLIASLAVVSSRAGEALIRELFEPLGYTVTTEHHPLDEKFPEWGDGPYYAVKLQGTVRLKDLLNHLYVLVPVLDAEKHYWIGKDEVEKLLRKGQGWLVSHPHKEAIVRRYLPRQRQLAREALARLTEEDNPDPDAAEGLFHRSHSRLLSDRQELGDDARRPNGLGRIFCPQGFSCLRHRPGVVWPLRGQSGRN